MVPLGSRYDPVFMGSVDLFQVPVCTRMVHQYGTWYRYELFLLSSKNCNVFIIVPLFLRRLPVPIISYIQYVRYRTVPCCLSRQHSRFQTVIEFSHCFLQLKCSAIELTEGYVTELDEPYRYHRSVHSAPEVTVVPEGRPKK
jgi:hypothetical protein